MGLCWLRGLTVLQRDNRPEAVPGRAAPVSPGPAYLARALGTRLIVQGEHLAVHHLPSLVVAICGGRGDRAMRAKAQLGASDIGVLVPLTSADRAAFPVGVERVGAGDGAVHRGAGHRAQLRDTENTQGLLLRAADGTLGKDSRITTERPSEPPRLGDRFIHSVCLLDRTQAPQSQGPGLDRAVHLSTGPCRSNPQNTQER